MEALTLDQAKQIEHGTGIVNELKMQRTIAEDRCVELNGRLSEVTFERDDLAAKVVSRDKIIADQQKKLSELEAPKLGAPVVLAAPIEETSSTAE